MQHQPTTFSLTAQNSKFLLALQSLLLLFVLPAAGQQSDAPSISSPSPAEASRGVLLAQQSPESVGTSAPNEEGNGGKIPQLPQELAKNVAKVEKVFDWLMTQTDLVSIDEINKLAEWYEVTINARREYQGEQWWETIDARQIRKR